MANYNGFSGKGYTLGNQLGAGGEGIVYEIQGDSSKVAKLYKDDKFKSVSERATMDRKLKAMVSMNLPVYVDGMLRLAWPLDILYKGSSMVGFVMPKIKSQYKIFDIQREGAIKKIYPNYTWKYAVQFAYNLSWVVKYLHDRNIVVGDLNQNNICIDTSTGAVILIDCDSFDITDPKTGEHFPCVVGLPEMLAPELQTVGHLKNGVFTKETDDFSLAIQVFRLLMKNADPFGGIITNSRSVSSIPANAPILNGECPYVRNIPGKVIAGWSPTLDMLPPDIQRLFKKTFDYDAVTALRKKNNRATASEWCNALAVLGAPEPNPNLQKCRVNSHHVYPKYSSYCPWCRCENYKQPVPVPVKATAPKTAGNQYANPKPAATINQTANTQQSNSIVRRTPYLFYIVLIVFGLASGFAFGRYVSDAVNASFGTYIDPAACTVLLSLVGVIGGASIAHHFEDRYTHADNAIPWLCLGIGVLFVPLIVALVLGIAAGIVMVIVAIVVYIIALIIGIVCAVAFCAGICSGS